MSDVIRVEVYDAQDTAFSITFLEPPLGKVTIQYEAESNRDMSKCFQHLCCVFTFIFPINFS